MANSLVLNGRLKKKTKKKLLPIFEFLCQRVNLMVKKLYGKIEIYAHFLPPPLPSPQH